MGEVLNTVQHYASGKVHVIDAVIEDGETKSEVISLGGATLKTFEFDANFDGTSLTFEVSHDGETMLTYKNADGDALELTCGSLDAVGVVANDFFGINYVRLVAGTSQTGDSTIRLVCRGV